MGGAASTTNFSDSTRKALDALPEAAQKELLDSQYLIRNDHPELVSFVPSHANEMMSNWILFLPAAAVAQFKLEPNMNADTGLEKTLWVGRLCIFRRILWLQYCKSRAYKCEVSDERKTIIEAHFKAPEAAKLLLKVQARLMGVVARMKSKPNFLSQLAGLAIRGIVAYVHGSGGMGWANPRLCRIAASAGCVVFAPDHLASDEWRSKEIKPLLNSGNDTGYWVHNLFYGKKRTTVDTDGDGDVDKDDELWFSTSVEGVRSDPGYYKALYEKVFQVRSAEIHYLVKRLPPVAQAFGVILFGTSEGAMTVHRFDDKRYGKLISGRIINAFGCEYCYFTPTLEAAKLGGSKDVPTLNIIGTCDEYFGPPPDESVTYSQGYKKSQPEGAEFPTYGTPGACGTAQRRA